MGLLDNYKVSRRTYVATAIICMVLGMGIERYSKKFNGINYLRAQLEAQLQKYDAPRASGENPMGIKESPSGDSPSTSLDTMLELIEEHAQQKITTEVRGSTYQKQALSICDPAGTGMRIKRMGAVSIRHPHHPYLDSASYFMEIEGMIMNIQDNALPSAPFPIAIIGDRDKGLHSIIQLDEEGRTRIRELYSSSLKEENQQLQKETIKKFLKYYDSKIKRKLRKPPVEPVPTAKHPLRSIENPLGNRAS